MNIKLQKVRRKIESFYYKPYKQFMFHFHQRNSIDARNISEEEMEWCLKIFNMGDDKRVHLAYEYRTITKMIELWFPQYLI